jgi:hypothetical protein
VEIILSVKYPCGGKWFCWSSHHQVLSLDIVQYLNNFIYLWSIGGIMAAVSQADHPLLVNDKITTHLSAVTLDSPPPATLCHQFGIRKPNFWTPGPD